MVAKTLFYFSSTCADSIIADQRQQTSTTTTAKTADIGENLTD